MWVKHARFARGNRKEDDMEEREARPREPDFEAHRMPRESQEGTTSPEETAEDESDVEAHIRARRPQTR